MRTQGCVQRSGGLVQAGMVLAGVLAVMLPVGCEGFGASGGATGGAARLTPVSGDREQWTIRCLRTQVSGHEEVARQMAGMLKQVEGLDPRAVRVVSDSVGSTIYYGRYQKAPSPTDGELVFPPEFQRDINRIRYLALDHVTPFFYAVPELIDRGRPSDHEEWLVTHARGKYTLQIAVFYNTPTFSQRREAAETYTQLLREEGYSAYFHHDALKSFVFVGDFGDQDVVETPRGLTFGRRVHELIERNPEQFRHITENGHLRRVRTPDGRMEPPTSYLVRVPERSTRASSEVSQYR